jgi:hypothetical protein
MSPAKSRNRERQQIDHFEAEMGSKWRFLVLAQGVEP